MSVRECNEDKKGIASYHNETPEDWHKIYYALNVSSILAITDKNGIITYANDKFCELSKYSRGELIGRTHSILNSGYHSKEFFSELWKTISKGEIWEGEIQNKAKDGSYYWIETVIIPLKNKENKVYQYVSIRKDITERKELEIISQLSTRIFQKMNEGIVITDTKGKILNVNEAYCSISGYSVNELLGKNPRVLKSHVHDQTFYQKLWNSLITTGNWEGEVWNRHKTGRLYLQKVYIIAIRDERNKIIFYVGVTTDISEEAKIRKDIIRTGKLQRSLLPLPIQEDQLEVHTIYTPSDYVSGDFFDYYWDKEQGTLSGYIIDIMGHGLTAAYQNSILRVLFKQNFDKNRSLVDVLTTINKESMNYFFEDTFAAALCFRLDVNKRILTYACAGINKFLIVNTDGERNIVKMAGSYLGILEESLFDEITIPVEQNESIFFLTDGLMDQIDIVNTIPLNGNFQSNVEQFKKMTSDELKDDATLIGIYLKPFGGQFDD
ncbi:PAS domain S-box protein [Bacillus sp. DTU_2020_1000418_1_SI_GHA_SEK_038]|uniref:SpoIIE family protein phosphatase n=1 Tax=Bacillus sp. DTU_2020_1000418_1_SI_GHA_SEK_038 TaxID=3077585 RepID=UPI0028EBA569|nr:PAS domain-containing protein [Bacillus sp. DTU_2020_1000418_1_SI_GHA_SEK_038]WNS75412.1 PAS domain S-box protein [Bacillus sp. DTU_2020_1000418_1_SI_GHA_SEK_038]